MCGAWCGGDRAVRMVWTDSLSDAGGLAATGGGRHAKSDASAECVRQSGSPPARAPKSGF